jgi:hypothetical protein
MTKSANARTALTALATGVILSLSLTSTALANNSGTIQLKGTVAAVCTIQVTDSSASLNITGGENNKPVGTVQENCNSGSGYTITITSQNGGNLKAGNAAVSYQVNYDGQTSGLDSAMVVTRQTAQFGKTTTVGVSMAANATAVAGSYADTLTLQIASK